MAEAVAAVSLIASIVSLVEISARLISRLHEYTEKGGKLPTTFQSLQSRLPLLSVTLQEIKDRIADENLSQRVADALQGVLNDITRQVALLNKHLGKLKLTDGASHIDRLMTSLKSLAKESDIIQAVEKVNDSIQVLTLFQTTKWDRIYEKLAKQLADLNTHQSTLTSVKKFGIQLGRAPSVEPSAFIGRRAELQQLQEWLEVGCDGQNHGQKIVSLVSLGGMGKTQLSLAYAREFGNLYSSVFWLSAKNELALQQSYSDVHAVVFPNGRLNETSISSAQSQDSQVKQMMAWLSRSDNHDWLLIFDNYDDPDLPNSRSRTGFNIQSYLPTSSQGHIIITTRSPKLTFTKQLKLKPIDNLEQCISILEKRAGTSLVKDESVKALVDRLGGLPLALSTAGNYIGQTNMTCVEYLEAYNSAWLGLTGQDSGELFEYADRTLSSTWTVSLDSVQRQDAEAVELLRLWSYFDNRDISFKLIQAGAPLAQTTWLDTLTQSRIRFNAAMIKLQSHSLVEVASNKFRIHPCLQDWIIEHFSSASDKARYLVALRCVKGEEREFDDSDYWSTARRLLPHVEQLLDRRFEQLCDDSLDELDAVDAIFNAAEIFQNCELWKRSEKLYGKALEGNERNVGSDHQRTLETVNRLGSICAEQEDFEKAEAYYNRALVGYEQQNGDGHARTANVMSNIGRLYLRKYQYVEAQAIYSKALHSHEYTTNPDQACLANVWEGLGMAYKGLGKLEAAEKAYRRALAIKEENSSNIGRVFISTTLCNLGNLCIDCGRYEEAEQLLKKALERAEAMWGFDSAMTWVTWNNLGKLYSKQDKPNDAAAAFEKALAANEVLFGLNNTTTIRNAYNLGITYKILKRYQEAEEMFKRVWSQRNTPNGDRLDMVSKSAYGLALMMWAQSKLDEAATYYIESIKCSEKHYRRTDHLDTLRTVYHLGMLRLEQKRLDEAEILLQRSREGRERQLPWDNENVILNKIELAKLFKAQGRLTEAAEMHEQSLKRIESRFGRKHSWFCEEAWNLGLAYKAVGRKDEASEMIKLSEGDKDGEDVEDGGKTELGGSVTDREILEVDTTQEERDTFG